MEMHATNMHISAGVPPSEIHARMASAMHYIESYPGTTCALGLALGHFGHAEYEGPEEIRAHCHADFELDLITEGEALYYVGDRSQKVRRGDICISRPGDRHGMTSTGGGWSFMFLHISELADAPLRMAISRASLGVLQGKLNLLTSFEAILSEARAGKFGFVQAAHGHATHVLVDVAREAALTSAASGMHEYAHAVQESLGYIEKRGSYATRVKDVADHVSLSVSRLSHLFAEETGTPLRSHLRNIIVERARRMLESESLTITEVAASLGFPDVGTFSKFFRCHQGCTPSAYRRHLRPEF